MTRDHTCCLSWAKAIRPSEDRNELIIFTRGEWGMGAQYEGEPKFSFCPYCGEVVAGTVKSLEPWQVEYDLIMREEHGCDSPNIGWSYDHPITVEQAKERVEAREAAAAPVRASDGFPGTSVPSQELIDWADSVDAAMDACAIAFGCATRGITNPWRAENVPGTEGEDSP